MTPSEYDEIVQRVSELPERVTANSDMDVRYGSDVLEPFVDQVNADWAEYENYVQLGQTDPMSFPAWLDDIDPPQAEGDWYEDMREARREFERGWF